MSLKIIITGATGMVGEGVLLECLDNQEIEHVLLVGRRHYGMTHKKLTELIIPDFLDLKNVEDQLRGYDACFFCAGVSVVGLNETEYTRITYDTTLHFAKTLVQLNPNMVFDYVSGKSTDSSEKGRAMWARVKGRTENALLQLPFRKVYNFRPGLMQPTKGQRNVKFFFKVIASLYPLLHALFPGSSSTLTQVGQAMINSVLKGYERQILEVEDIKVLARK